MGPSCLSLAGVFRFDGDIYPKKREAEVVTRCRKVSGSSVGWGRSLVGSCRFLEGKNSSWSLLVSGSLPVSRSVYRRDAVASVG
jgi:hypothetical protein